MPFYIGGGIGPLRWYHRLGRRGCGHHGRPGRVRDWSPAASWARCAAGLLMLAVCAAILVSLVAAVL